MADEPLLDAGDIQGNIIPGFRRKAQLLVYYRAPSEDALRAALAVLAPLVTPMAPVFRHRDTVKAALTAGEEPPEIPDLWVNLALGATALDRLGEREVRSLDEAFDVGMRPTRTGDPWKPVDAEGGPNPSHPSNWKVGRPGDPLALLLILAFDDRAAAGVDELLARLAAAGVEEIDREDGVRLKGDSEHFGFGDGIAEVGVRGEVEIDGAVRPVTTRYGVPARDGVEYGRPGQPLVWPGQILVGTEIGAGEVDPAPERYRNGSFLVFRRLSQDVRAFDEDTAQMAQDLAAAGLAMTPERLRGLIVGRWPSGAALMRHAEDPGVADGLHAANYFAFVSEMPDLQLAVGAVAGARGDPAPLRGLQCPGFAHIRKVNPRDLPTNLGDPPHTLGLQMLRRGIPFGPPYDRTDPDNPVNGEDRGLLFLAYQRAPSRQFEPLNSNWMNLDNGPTAGGHDLLVGQHVPIDSGLHAPKSATLFPAAEPAPGHDFSAARTWVTPTGGAYLFAPSCSHIRSLAAALPAPPAVEIRQAVLALGAEAFLDVAAAAGPPVLPRHDGEAVTVVRAGRERLREARWPATALLPATAPALSGAALQALDLSGDHFPEETLTAVEADALAGEPELRSLMMDGVTLDGATLAALARQLPRLTALNLAGCDLDDADVGTLAAAAPGLAEIALGMAEERLGHRFPAPRLTGAAVRALAGLTGLRRLVLRSVPVTDPDVTASDLWDRLDSANLADSNVGNAGARRLALSPRLEVLNLEGTKVDDDGAAVLLARPWRGLTLSWTRVSQATLLEAGPLDGLEQLGLAGTAVDDGLAGLLRRAPDLAEVDLSGTDVSDGVAAELGGMRRLARLRLNGTRLTPAGVAQLAGAPLTDLEIREVTVDAAAMAGLGSIAGLRRAALSVGADWSGLDALAATVELRARNYAGGEVPPRLTELWLGGEVTPDLAERLARVEFAAVAQGGQAGAGHKVRRRLRRPQRRQGGECRTRRRDARRPSRLAVDGSALHQRQSLWRGAAQRLPSLYPYARAEGHRRR